MVSRLPFVVSDDGSNESARITIESNACLGHGLKLEPGLLLFHDHLELDLGRSGDFLKGCEERVKTRVSGLSFCHHFASIAAVLEVGQCQVSPC